MKNAQGSHDRSSWCLICYDDSKTAKPSINYGSSCTLMATDKLLDQATQEQQIGTIKRRKQHASKRCQATQPQFHYTLGVCWRAVRRKRLRPNVRICTARHVPTTRARVCLPVVQMTTLNSPSQLPNPTVRIASTARMCDWPVEHLVCFAHVYETDVTEKSG